MNNLKKHILALSVFAVLLAADMITKHLAELYIAQGDRINVVGSFVQLIRIYNQGGVFGIFQGYQHVFMVISMIVFVFMLIFYGFEKNKTYPFCIAMGMILSGAVGNISDRLMQKPGVVDFIYVGIEGLYKWPAFNVADMAIVCGAVMLGIVFYRQERRLQSLKVHNPLEDDQPKTPTAE